MRRHLNRSAAGAITLVVALVALVAPATALEVRSQHPARPVRTVQAPPPTPLTWTPCGDGGECATLTVPRDYRRPRKGGSAEVALFRVPARDPAQRVGSLLMNPGGPGASGVAFVRTVHDELPAELRDRFDLVGFDPRGTGGTLPIDCGQVLDQAFSLDYTPDSAGERDALLAGTGDVVRQCEDANRTILRRVSSVSTVRDLDRIRRALGDEQLTYVGYSYGTYLGSLYADRYPKRVRALLLDGAVDPKLTARETALQQARGFELSLDAFLAACSADVRCDFHNGGDTAGAFDALVTQIDASPLNASDGRIFGPGLFDIAVLRALYFGESAYDGLGEALAAAAQGDPDPMLELADEYMRRGDAANENTLEAFWAIGCRDGPGLGDPAEFEALEPEFTAAAPRLGITALNLALMCAHWPVRHVHVDVPDAKGAGPILVVGTEGDPATPVEWAQGLVDELASGVLLTAAGGRHSSFVFGGIPCVDDHGVRYLVDLVVPPDGTRCDLPS